MLPFFRTEEQKDKREKISSLAKLNKHVLLFFCPEKWKYVSESKRFLWKQPYFLFLLSFHSLVMSSSVLPFVSGTSFQTNRAAATQMIPYKP